MNEQTPQAPFRIGGYYRNGYGALCLIGGRTAPGKAEILRTWDEGGVIDYCRLSDGAADHCEVGDGMSLIPGECNAQGEPIAPTFYCAAETLSEPKTFIKRVPRKTTTEPEKLRPRLTWADSKPFDNFADYEVCSDTATPDHAYSHPLTRVADAGAQTNPKSGSAYLVG